MKCCVGTCSRAATVQVTFAATGATHPYCNWHAFDRNENPRWKSEAVANIERIR